MKNNERRDTFMEGIIDRFEGEIVIIEIDGHTQDVSKSLVDPAASPGDVVDLVNGKWVTNPEKTKNQSDRINRLAEELWEE
ncbi:DUF3006 domain-containing protein [Paenibacillus glucanolyticus]|nr:DUF3006 domain-containing protein [Paenibacillus glucanolyticus]